MSKQVMIEFDRREFAVKKLSGFFDTVGLKQGDRVRLDGVFGNVGHVEVDTRKKDGTRILVALIEVDAVADIEVVGRQESLLDEEPDEDGTVAISNEDLASMTPDEEMARG